MLTAAVFAGYQTRISHRANWDVTNQTWRSVSNQIRKQASKQRNKHPENKNKNKNMFYTFMTVQGLENRSNNDTVQSGLKH